MRILTPFRRLLLLTVFITAAILFWIHLFESYQDTQIKPLAPSSVTKKIITQETTGTTSSVKHTDNIHKPPSSKKPDLILRTAEVEKVCQRLAPTSTTTGQSIMTNKAHKLAYCFIPKCGCTFWKRVIRFLNKDYKGDGISSPFQIPRLESHSMWSNPDTFVPFKQYSKNSTSYTSFMFVREPYARLWSAYVDKLFLPDFWSNLRNQIISKRPPSAAKKCVSDVTFQEFTNLVLTVSEPHWDPIHKMCDPCSYKPSLVGRVESFTSDSRFILEKANLSWILEGYDHTKHVEEELRMLIDYNLKDVLALKPYIRKCISKVGLFQRLWKAFQINGYIPADDSLPSVDQDTTTAHFKDIVLNRHRQRPNTSDVWRKQRREFMIAAYKNVSTSTLYLLKKKYEKDFLLFNYDPEPVDIFGNRKMKKLA